MWHWFAIATAVTTTGSGVDTLTPLLPGVGADALTTGTGGVLALATLLACPLLHRGLIVWNRVQTRTTDPGDRLNGRSATTALGADEVQGYVHARPQPAAAFATWLRQHHDERARQAVGGARTHLPSAGRTPSDRPPG